MERLPIRGGPLDLAWTRTAGNYLDLDTRIWFFTDYYSISPGMISQTPGQGAKYMIAFTDSAGTPLSGGASYRLKLPPNIPAANFWSVTLYEAENARVSPTASRSLRPARATSRCKTPMVRPIFIWPESTGRSRSATGSRRFQAKGYFAILRLYGPTEAAINKSGFRETLSRSSERGRETNWIPTDAKGRFEVLFRLYGPQKPFFDKKWVPPDIERVN